MIAMLIPGVSGAMILVLIGTYADVVQLIKEKDVAALLPFIVGAVIGGGVTVKGIQWLIKQYSDHFESFILGAIIGSMGYIANQISWSTAHPVGLIAIFGCGICFGTAVNPCAISYLNRPIKCQHLSLIKRSPMYLTI